MTARLPSWSIDAVNLAEHADNLVHTHEGGIAAGYGGAVVAGTTIYAYLTRPAAQGWGLAWVRGGSAEVRFRAPILADERVDVVANPDPSGLEPGRAIIEARGPTGLCATLDVGLGGDEPLAPTGERLEPLVVELGERWVGYAARAGEDLALYAEHGIVHPVGWPALANRVFATQLVDGPWIHTRSSVRHLGTAAPGDTAVVEAWVVDRFEGRTGERAVVDVRISVERRPVAVIEHEAIVRLSTSTGR